MFNKKPTDGAPIGRNSHIGGDAAATATATAEPRILCNTFEPLATPLQIFSARGGLSMLAHYLPTSYADTPKSLLPPCATGPEQTVASYTSAMLMAVNDIMMASGASHSDWVKLDLTNGEDIYGDDADDSLTDTPTTTVASKVPMTLTVPQHSLSAFALFLRLPAYSEVLLQDRLKAQCLLRLVLGVTGDGEGSKCAQCSHDDATDHPS